MALIYSKLQKQDLISPIIGGLALLLDSAL